MNNAQTALSELKDHLKAASKLTLWLLYFAVMYIFKGIQAGYREVRQICIEYFHDEHPHKRGKRGI